MSTYTEVLLGDLRIPEFAEEKPLGLRANAEIYNLFGFNCFRFLVSDRAFSVAVPADACSNANVHATYNRLLAACAAAGEAFRDESRHVCGIRETADGRLRHQADAIFRI
jgi:hypothetical protein